MTLSFYLRLPTMPFYSWGYLLKPFGGSPPEKMHAHPRSLIWDDYISISVPNHIDLKLLFDFSVLPILQLIPVQFPNCGASKFR
jgi:hypothetical protein